MNLALAPELIVTDWINTSHPFRLHELRGRVVVIEAFQMLCPGCVSHGLPQAAQIAQMFPSSAVQVIGLHSVFEHHDVQGTLQALRAFNHEYRWPFPIAIDEPSVDGAIPRTMGLLALKGTPSMVIIDPDGVIRHNHFGRPSDMLVGAQIMELVSSQNSFKNMLSVPKMLNTKSNKSCDGDACTS